MKIRSGFVSNSSSSSFIVIGTVTNGIAINRLREEYGNRDSLSVTPDLGCHEFGWENEKYTNVWDRIMFAWIQAAEMQKSRDKSGRPEWMKMLNKVMKDAFKVKQVHWNLSIEWSNTASGDWCYIDHQSAATEGQNTEMFESEEQLRNFLFAHDSYIQGGNDNE